MAQRRSTNNSSAMSSFLNPVNGVRGKLAQKGIQPRNHMKDNKLGIRMQQERHREEREEAARPRDELFKLSQFREVNSRVYEDAEPKSGGRQDYITKGSAEMRRQMLAQQNRVSRRELEDKAEEAKYYAEKPATPRKSAVPKNYEIAKLAGKSSTDFISRNKMKAFTTMPKYSQIDEGNKLHNEYGRVPEYLEERKNKWAQEKADIMRRQPDPSCPPGMSLMPEAERKETLQTLLQSKTEAMAQLRRLPMVVETETMRKKQDFLEGKLREIDHAIGIFSKPKVFVAMR